MFVKIIINNKYKNLSMFYNIVSFIIGRNFR